MNLSDLIKENKPILGHKIMKFFNVSASYSTESKTKQPTKLIAEAFVKYRALGPSYLLVVVT